MELNKEHHITDKIGHNLQKVGSAVQSWDAKHDVSGKVSSGITAAMNGITRALQPKEGNPPPPPPPGHEGVYRR